MKIYFIQPCVKSVNISEMWLVGHSEDLGVDGRKY